MNSRDPIVHAYKILREVLGNQKRLLGEYEFLSNGVVQVADWAIAVPGYYPHPQSNFRLKSPFGLEAILEWGGVDLLPAQPGSSSLATIKLTLNQHAKNNYRTLLEAIEATYSVPSLRPFKNPIYRPAMPLVGTSGSISSDYLPAIAVMYLIVS